MLARARPLPAEHVPLARAAGRILAAASRAASTCRRSRARRWTATRSAPRDTPGVLPVVGHSAAGRPASRALGPGEAIGISTGAVVPDGADAVVPVERVVVRPTGSRSPPPLPRETTFASRGGDVRAGDEVARGRERRSPRRASARSPHAGSRRSPRTGVPASRSSSPAPSCDRPESDARARPDLRVERDHARARARGGGRRSSSGSRRSRGRRRRTASSARARRSRRTCVVTSGGVSVGPHDLVRRVEAGLGVEEVFWGVAMRPGKPLAFGVRGATLVFGLPGQPALVARRVPALRRPGAACAPGRTPTRRRRFGRERSPGR